MRRHVYREVVFYRNYFEDFYTSLHDKARLKVDWTLQLIETTKRVPSKFLKSMTGTDGIYEIRVVVGKDSIRIFCFFDEGKLVVLINAFFKKSQKTPRRELDRAVRLRKQYFDEKK